MKYQLLVNKMFSRMNCFLYYCRYGSKLWLQSVHLKVGPAPGLSSIIAPILQWNILDSLSNTDNVIIPEFRILLFTRRNTLV